MKQALFMIILLLAAGISQAEVTTLSLSNAIELAERNSKQVQQLAADVKIAEAQYGQSFADFWVPNVLLSAGATYLDQATVTNSYIDAFGIITNYALPMPYSFYPKKITNTFQDNYSVALGISKPLFMGFRLWDSMRVKSINLETAKKKLSDKRKEIEINTRNSFYNLILLRKTISINENLMADISKRLNDTLDKYSAGAVSEFDKTRAEVQYENALPALDKIKDAYQVARSAFSLTLGMDATDSVQWSGDISDSTNGIPSVQEESVLASALSNDINLRALDDSIEMMKIARNITAAAKYPVLAGFFNYKVDYRKANMNDADRGWINGWNGGLSLTIPVDDWLPFSKTAQMEKESDANVEKLLAARALAADGVRLSVKTLWVQMNEAKQLVFRYSGTEQKAKRAFNLSEDRYSTGTTSSLEVTDAEMQYCQIRTALLQAIYDYSAAWNRLTQYL